TRRVPGIITQQGARGSRDFVVLRQTADADIPDAMPMTKEEMIAPQQHRTSKPDRSTRHSLSDRVLAATNDQKTPHLSAPHRPADLKRLHKYMLNVEHIGIVSDEMREVVEELWPELVHKLAAE